MYTHTHAQLHIMHTLRPQDSERGRRTETRGAAEPEARRSARAKASRCTYCVHAVITIVTMSWMR